MLGQLFSMLGFGADSSLDSENSSSLSQELSEYCSRPFPIIISNKQHGLSRLNETDIATEVTCHGISLDKAAIDGLIAGANRNPHLKSISFINCTFEVGMPSYLKENIQNNVDISLGKQSDKHESKKRYR